MTNRAIIQFLIILIGVVFEVMGIGYPSLKMTFSNELIPVRGYVYYVCEHLKFIALSLMMFLPSTESDIKTDRLFVILAGIDFLDYLLVGNNVWFSVTLPNVQPILPISINTVSIVVFYFYARKQWRMNGYGALY